MSDTVPPSSPHYNQGTNADTDMKVLFVINDRAEAMVYHDKPFSKDLSWLEYNLDTSKLDFVLEDGDTRNFGIDVDPKVSKLLQNAYQIRMVLADMIDGEQPAPKAAGFFPLIIHRD